jgi:hypothetical protein
MGFARLINSGRVTKFISAAQVARTSTHIFVSRDLPARSVQNHGVRGLRRMWTFDMVEKLERDAGHLGVDPAPVRERAEKDQKSIGVSVGSLLLRELAANYARWLGVSRRKLLPFSPNARCAPGRGRRFISR